MNTLSWSLRGCANLVGLKFLKGLSLPVCPLVWTIRGTLDLSPVVSGQPQGAESRPPSHHCYFSKGLSEPSEFSGSAMGAGFTPATWMHPDPPPQTQGIFRGKVFAAEEEWPDRHGCHCLIPVIL